MRSLIALLLTVVIFPASAEIFHYVDDKGRKVFVNRESQIPHKYRKQVEVREESRSLNGLEPGPELDPRINQIKREIHRSLEDIDAALAELETPVELTDNRIVLPVTAVYGNRSVETRMLLDTGASGTVFHRDALKNLNGATYRAGEARVASGDKIPVDAINLDRMEGGPFKVESTRAMVIDPVGRSTHDGLLGMDFLRQVEYRVDYERSVMVWEPDRYEELQAEREKLRAQVELEAEALIESLSKP